MKWERGYSDRQAAFACAISRSADGQVLLVLASAGVLQAIPLSAVGVGVTAVAVQ